MKVGIPGDDANSLKEALEVRDYELHLRKTALTRRLGSKSAAEKVMEKEARQQMGRAKQL